MSSTVGVVGPGCQFSLKASLDYATYMLRIVIHGCALQIIGNFSNFLQHTAGLHICSGLQLV